MERKIIWVTAINGRIDIETASYTRKAAIEKCLKLITSYTWKQLYKWGRRTHKIEIHLNKNQ